MRASRGIRQASDGDLAGLRDAVKQLMVYDRLIAGDLLTALCVLDEAAKAEQRRRETAAEPARLRQVR